MWQGQVWEARLDGESMRGKAKFGKRHGSRKVRRRELRNTKASLREGEETAENPLPPIQCATQVLPHPQAGIRACGGRYVNQNGWFSDLALRRWGTASACSLVEEQKKSIVTVPFWGPSGGTKNETPKSQNQQQGRPAQQTKITTAFY